MKKGALTVEEHKRTIPTLSDRLWDRIQALGRPVCFGSGETLYLQNAPSGGFFFIESGLVKVSHILDDGSESIVALYGNRDLVGEASALQSDSSPAAVAFTPVRAFLVPTETAYDLISHDPEFARYVVDMLAYKLRMVNARLCTIAGKHSRQRLAATLLLLAEFGVTRDKDGWYVVTHAELASYAGSTRANTTTLLRELAEEGLVATRRGGIRILGPDGLRAISESTE